ncbi:MAG TPA: hypothetical protein PKI14_01295 [Fervidobacterium sp.]|nr:hypothetical protein [Fervidobacterium sp.]
MRYISFQNESRHRIIKADITDLTIYRFNLSTNIYVFEKIFSPVKSIYHYVSVVVEERLKIDLNGVPKHETN